MIKKKMISRAAAVLMAGALAVASFPATVLADEALAQTFSEEMDKGKESFIEGYNMVTSAFSNMGTIDVSAFELQQDALVELTIGDGGKAMLGAFGMDMSWFQNIALKGTFTVKEGNVYFPFEAVINDNHVVGGEFLVNAQSGDVYVSLPDISDGTIYINKDSFMQLMQQSGGVNAGGMDMNQLMEMIQALPNYLPDGENVFNLIKTYFAMALKNLQIAEGAGDTLSAGGVSQTSASTLTFTMNSIDIVNLVKEALPALRDDADLKAVVEKFAPLTGQADLYAQLQAQIDNLLSTMGDTSQLTGEEMVVSTTVFLGEDGQPFGFNMLMNQQGQAVNMALYAPTEGEKTGFAFYVDAQGQNIQVEGSGTKDASGALSGDYVVSMNDAPMFNINIANMLCTPESTTGTITLSVAEQPAPAEGEASYNPLASLKGFSLIVELDSNATASDVKISVASNGAVLATLHIATASSEATAEIPSAESFSKIYDVTNQEDMQNFSANINPQVIMENIVKAGVPQEFITQITSMFGGFSGATAPGTPDDGSVPTSDNLVDDAEAGEQPAA